MRIYSLLAIAIMAVVIITISTLLGIDYLTIGHGLHPAVVFIVNVIGGIFFAYAIKELDRYA